VIGDMVIPCRAVLNYGCRVRGDIRGDVHGYVPGVPRYASPTGALALHPLPFRQACILPHVPLQQRTPGPAFAGRASLTAADPDSRMCSGRNA
jgi:hypothetical protein